MSDEAITTAELNRRLSVVEKEHRACSVARHEANARIGNIVDAERAARMRLEETVRNLAEQLGDLAEKQSEMVDSVKTLVTAIGGGPFGQPGFAQEITSLKKEFEESQEESRAYRDSLDAKFNEIKGMMKLIWWIVSFIGLVCSVLGVVLAMAEFAAKP